MRFVTIISVLVASATLLPVSTLAMPFGRGSGTLQARAPMPSQQGQDPPDYSKHHPDNGRKPGFHKKDPFPLPDYHKKDPNKDKGSKFWKVPPHTTGKRSLEDVELLVRALEDLDARAFWETPRRSLEVAGLFQRELFDRDDL